MADNSMKYLLTGVLALTLFLCACKKENSRESAPEAWLELHFSAEMNGSPLVLNQGYSNIFGENIQPTALKFYAGRFSLVPAGAPAADTIDQYSLVDFSSPSSTLIRLPVTPGTYDRFSFQLGVDSARNVSGTQTGALDPALGMFWTWNSGYIFFKFEGKSPASVEPGGIFQYHIGGFRSPYSAIRSLNAELPAADTWTLADGQTLRLELGCQMDLFFNGNLGLRVADHPVSMTPGELSSAIADNYASCFTLTNYTVQ